MIRAEDRRRMTGLEYMRQLMTGDVTPSGMAQLMGFRLVEVNEGHAVFQSNLMSAITTASA